MQDDTVYDIFHFLSRIIVLFTIIVLIIGLIIRFNQNKPNIQSFVTNQKPTVTTPMEQSSTQTISSSAAELNLKGPFVCDFSSPEATISAFVKDNNAYGQLKEQTKTTSILLKGDCIYFWKNLSSEGEKVCGLSPYLTIFGQMPIVNLLGNNQMLSLIGGSGINQSVIPSILNSCKKEEIKDAGVFNLPMNVIFKESKTKSILNF